jgi:hypothetical protein
MADRHDRATIREKSKVIINKKAELVQPVPLFALK